MKDYNKIIVYGHVTKDAEMHYTQNQKAICKFTVANNTKDDEANFFNCDLWDKYGETMKEYLTKGKPVLVDGELKIRKYEKDGEKRTAVSITVKQVQLVGAKKND